jgi:hypothetical protein
MLKNHILIRLTTAGICIKFVFVWKTLFLARLFLIAIY